MQDEEAVRRCLAGDDQAFQVLYERYYSVLFGTAYLMTRDRKLAEDFVQEAFFRAWKGLKGFKGINLKPWLVRIVINQSLQHLRRHTLPTGPLSANVSVTSNDPVGDRIAQVEGASRYLDVLPDNELRQVVLLRYYADLTMPEIAEATGWPEGTVKSRLHRAMALLKRVAKQEGTVFGDD